MTVATLCTGHTSISRCDTAPKTRALAVFDGSMCAAPGFMNLNGVANLSMLPCVENTGVCPTSWLKCWAQQWAHPCMWVVCFCTRAHDKPARAGLSDGIRSMLMPDVKHTVAAASFCN